MSTTDPEAARQATCLVVRPSTMHSRSVDPSSDSRESSPPSTGDPRPPRDAGRESEKIGLVEAILASDHYRSILELGCGTGDLARLLVERCDSYTGVDADSVALAEARRRVCDEPSPRFVPLALPLDFPSGEHQLVVLSELLQLLEPFAVLEVARCLAAHTPCREIVVISASDEHADGRDAALEAFVVALSNTFEYQELAVRRHYRIDALLRTPLPASA